MSQYTTEQIGVPLAPGVTINPQAQTVVAVLRAGGTFAMGDAYADAYYHTTSEGKDNINYPELGGISESATGDRTEYVVTLGYQVIQGLSVFGGYRESETLYSGDLNTDFDFEHSGFFVGAGYTFLIGESTSLSFNAAYADLDADLDIDFLGNQQSDESGSGDGIKVGVASRTSLSDKWSLLFAADYLQYEYDMNSALGPFDFEEREVQFRVGLSYTLP